MEMTTQELKKLKKALELIERAEELINQTVSSSDKFKYDGNTTSLRNKIAGSIEILKDYN